MIEQDVPPYTINCDDPALSAALHSWLDQSRLRWPASITLDVERVDSIEFEDDTREVFSQPSMSIQAGAPHQTVRVRWLDTRAEAIVHPTEPRATIRFTPAAAERFEAAERSFLLVTLLFVLRRVGWYHIHCALLTDPIGRGWMLVGHSQSGKSTTTALLASNGWSVSTDDTAFISSTSDSGIVGLSGFWSPIALRAGGQQLLGTTGGIEFARRGKMGFKPEDFSGAWTPHVVPEFIVFPRIGEETSVTPISARVAMNALIESSIWVLLEPVHAQEHLDALGRLIKQSRVYSATLGPDLFAKPSLLLDAVP